LDVLEFVTERGFGLLSVESVGEEHPITTQMLFADAIFARR
jgi:hypothetical protein